jgi:hypothetical protein
MDLSVSAGMEGRLSKTMIISPNYTLHLWAGENVPVTVFDFPQDARTLCNLPMADKPVKMRYNLTGTSRYRCAERGLWNSRAYSGNNPAKKICKRCQARAQHYSETLEAKESLLPLGVSPEQSYPQLRKQFIRRMLSEDIETTDLETVTTHTVADAYRQLFAAHIKPEHKENFMRLARSYDGDRVDDEMPEVSFEQYREQVMVMLDTVMAEHRAAPMYLGVYTRDLLEEALGIPKRVSFF